jgi:glycosidase
LLLTLPGTPYLYYGEELGMRGNKPDPDLREPMRWQRRADAAGESRWKKSSVAPADDVSVQAEQDDPASLLNFYRRLIGWRAQVPALRDGSLRSIPSGNPRLVVFVREDARGAVLVVHNLFTQAQTFVPAGNPRVTAIRLQSGAGATFHQGTLRVPAYSTVVLQ